MEDALKARLIGASILVMLAVALLPELLSGPKTTAIGASGAKGTRVITIDLGGAVEASRAPRPDVVPTPATAATPMPAVEPPAEKMATTDDENVGEPSDEPGPPVAAPNAAAHAASGAVPAAVATPVVQSDAAPKMTASKGGISVQVGAFGSADGARKLVRDLQADGFPAYVLVPAAGKKLHRVRVGPVPDRAAADKLATRLKARGLPVAVVSDG
jgi:DedD protein